MYQEALSRQLALDYCCSPADVADSQNHFTIYVPQEGRRRFQEQAVFCEIVWMRDFSAVQVLTMTEKGGTIRNESVVTEMPDCPGVRNNSFPGME